MAQMTGYKDCVRLLFRGPKFETLFQNFFTAVGCKRCHFMSGQRRWTMEDGRETMDEGTKGRRTREVENPGLTCQLLVSLVYRRSIVGRLSFIVYRLSSIVYRLSLLG